MRGWYSPRSRMKPHVLLQIEHLDMVVSGWLMLAPFHMVLQDHTSTDAQPRESGSIYTDVETLVLVLRGIIHPVQSPFDFEPLSLPPEYHYGFPSVSLLVVFVSC